MAQDSIAYGESLLADVRKRNDDIARRAKKDEERGQWKALAVKIGMDVADDVFAEKQNTLLNSESALKAKLGTTRALDFGTRYTQAQTEAQEFAGGEDAYWIAQAAPQVENYLRTQYSEGTYNKSAYNLYANQLATKYGQELKAQHKGGYDLTQKFFAAGGQDKDAYVNAVKASQPSTTFKGISNWIGKSTGLLDADLNNNTEKLLETAGALTEYKEAYSQTKDAPLSAFLAQEGLMGNVDLGVPTAEVGTPLTVKNDFGGEEIVIPVTDPLNKTVTMVKADSNGIFSLDTPEARGTRKNFDSISDSIHSGKAPTLMSAGTDAIANLDAETNEKLTEAIKDRIDMPTSSGLYADAVKNQNKRVHAQAGAIVYTATKLEDWATITEAKLIAAEMVSSAHINGTQQRALAGSGLKNPYHTMFAINSVIDSEKMGVTDAISKLGSDENLMNLYNAYRTETIPARESIDAQLKATNYFEGRVGPLFMQLHETIKSVVDKGIEGTEENLVREHANLFKSKTAPDKPEPEVAVLDSSIDDIMSTLTAPPATPKGRRNLRQEDNQRRKQRLDYMGVVKANKELQRVLSFDQSALTVGAYQKLLNKAQKDFEKQAAMYKKMYD